MEEISVTIMKLLSDYKATLLEKNKIFSIVFDNKYFRIYCLTDSYDFPSLFLRKKGKLGNYAETSNR